MNGAKKALGGGVYASFDGRQIRLETKHGREVDYVNLGPGVLGALLRYAHEINAQNRVNYFPVVEKILQKRK